VIDAVEEDVGFYLELHLTEWGASDRTSVDCEEEA
jgi:hypothetical protein